MYDYNDEPDGAVRFMDTCRTVFISIGGGAGLGLIAWLATLAVLNLVAQ